MTKLNILTYPHENLQTRCDQVKNFDKTLRKLLIDMRSAMIEADGVGLAAPQVGIEKRIAIVENDDGNVISLINPVLLEQSGSQVGTEGCLSFPGLFGEVDRPSKIKIRAQDKFGKYFTLEAKDFFARVILHEMDHLEGILFPSKSITLYNEELS
ncbi:peptide deformylase [Bacillus sp. AK128]